MGRIPFPEYRGDSPEANLEALYAAARSAPKFGVLDYDAPCWEVSAHVDDKPGPRGVHGARSLWFIRYREHRWLPAEPLVLAADLARAYVRLLPRASFMVHGGAVFAFRALEEAMIREGVASVPRITPAVLTRAVGIARAWVGFHGSTACGRRLASIARFLAEGDLVHAAGLGDWRPPRRKDEYLPDRSTGAARERKAASLPPPGYMEALADAYGLASEDRDVIVTSAGVLLCCAPERINEVMALAVDCEVDGVGPDGQPILELRWRGSKGFPDAVKYVASAMREVAKDALARVREVTREGRAIKRWYDANPDRLYLPDGLRHLRGKSALDMGEAAALLGIPTARDAQQALSVAGFRDASHRNGKFLRGATVAFADIEAHVLGRLPRRMADAGGRAAKQPLFIVQERLFMRRCGWRPIPCMFEAVSYHHIANALGKPCTSMYPTVFHRLGLDPDRKLACGTHAFRHLLNDLCFRGGLSASDIALWSGRADKRSNRAYDHLNDEDIRHAAHKIDVSSRLLRPGKPNGDRPRP